MKTARLLSLLLVVAVSANVASAAAPTLLGTRTGTVSNSGTLSSWSPPQAWSITINWTATSWSDGINRLSVSATGTKGYCSVVIYKRASVGGSVLHSYYNGWNPGDATSTVTTSGASFDITTGQVWEIEAQGTLDMTPTPDTVSLVESVVLWDATGAPPTLYKTNLSYFNKEAYSVDVDIQKDGVSIGYYTVGAGTFWSMTLTDLASTTPTYTLHIKKPGLTKGPDESWFSAPIGTVYTAQTWTLDPSKMSPVGDPNGPANTQNTPTTTNLPAALPTATNTSSAWRPPTVTGNNTIDSLTNATFREGIDKVTARQDEQKTKQDEAKTLLQQMVQPNGNITQATANTTNTASANSLKSLAESAMGTGVTELGTLAPAAGSAPSPTGTNILLTVSMPGGSSKEVKASGVVSAVDSGATWCREAFLWGMALMFVMAAHAKFERYNIAMPAVPQLTTSTDVVGMTFVGGLAKQAIVAGIILGVVVAFIIGLIGFMNTKLSVLVGSSWNFNSVFNPGALLIGTGYSTQGSTAFTIIDRFFPIFASIQYSVAWVGLGIVTAGSFMVAAAVTRAVRI